MTRRLTRPLVRSLPSPDAAAAADALSAFTSPLKMLTLSTLALALARAAPLCVEVLPLARPLPCPPLPLEETYPIGVPPSPLSRAYALALAVATRALLAVGLPANAPPAATAPTASNAPAALPRCGITD